MSDPVQGRVERLPPQRPQFFGERHGLFEVLPASAQLGPLPTFAVLFGQTAADIPALERRLAYLQGLEKRAGAEIVGAVVSGKLVGTQVGPMYRMEWRDTQLAKITPEIKYELTLAGDPKEINVSRRVRPSVKGITAQFAKGLVGLGLYGTGKQYVKVNSALAAQEELLAQLKNHVGAAEFDELLGRASKALQPIAGHDLRSPVPAVQFQRVNQTGKLAGAMLPAVPVKKR